MNEVFACNPDEAIYADLAMSDATLIIAELQDFSGRLDVASRDLYKLQLEFDEVAEKYDDVFNDILIALLDQYEEEGKRSSEDGRNARVTKKMREVEPILFGQYRRLRKELDRKERLAKSIEKQISGRQSQLSYLKVEASAIG